MKRILILFLALITVFAMASCGKKNTDIPVDDDDKAAVGNTETPSKDEDKPSDNDDITVEDVKNAKESAVSLFEYEEVDGGVSITGYTGNEKIVSIPQNIDGEKVIKISKQAFANNKQIEGVYVGDNVSEIGEGSFTNCKSLKVVVYGPSVKTTKKLAFCACEMLATVELNEGIEVLEDGSFSFTIIEELLIPDTVTKIGIIFTKDENITRRIIASKGTAAEEYATKSAEVCNLEFQEK